MNDDTPTFTTEDVNGSTICFAASATLFWLIFYTVPFGSFLPYIIHAIVLVYVMLFAKWAFLYIKCHNFHLMDKKLIDTVKVLYGHTSATKVRRLALIIYAVETIAFCLYLTMTSPVLAIVVASLATLGEYSRDNVSRYIDIL